MNLRLIFWTIISGAIGVFSMYFLVSVFPVGLESSNATSAVVLNSVKGQEKPKYFYLNKNEDSSKDLKVSAQAYLVGDLNTGEVILSKNQDKQFPIASVSKLMTAAVAKEIMSAEDTAQVSRTALATYGKNGAFRLGEKIKISDLLYPLLLESSNDAGEVIAEHFGRDSFIAKMNALADKLQMSKTSYEDPSGLSPNNKSTPADIFKLAGYLTQEKSDLLKITTEKSYSVKNRTWSNIGQFVHKDGFIGGKSGYTDAAKQTVVSLFSLPLGDNSKNSGNRPIAITLLQSTDRGRDVENIIKYLKENIYYGGASDASTDWVKQKIGTPNIKDPNFVTLTFAGDIMLDRGVRNSVLKNFNNDYSKLFEKLGLLKKSDIVFANLEGPASDQGVDQKNLYSFRMDPAVIPAMKGAGVSVLSVANNHMGDWGLPAYIDTLSRLKENEILYIGGGYNSAEAETPAIIEKYGIKIGYLGFSDVGPGSLSAKTEQAGVLLANNPRFAEIINNASKQVDYLVVSFHFGDEYKEKHNARQGLLAHKAIDNGAKVVIGHHPHVIQDTEVYSPKDCAQSSCIGFIAYSLGNFIFDQSFSQNTMQGMLLEVKLLRDGSMTVKKNTMKLSKAFQPDTIILGKEEKVKFK